MFFSTSPADMLQRCATRTAARRSPSLCQDAGVRLFPVGRLDCMSEGLLLFTDDGEMANRLAHPSHGVSKTYRVWVSGPDAAEAAGALRCPIVYEGVRYRAAEVRVLRSAEDRALIDVTIREGKNREVRNMCAAAGLKVQRLLRIRQGEISLGDLPAGQWRYLTAKELEYLQSLALMASFCRIYQHELQN